jgi:hypothetical protein
MVKPSDRCCIKFCSKPAASKGMCHAHAKQEWARLNPLRYCYNNLRTNARRRGKPFELTFAEFSAFAVETDYINKRGTGSESFTIDRIDPTKGYTPDNIQVLTNAQNVRKYARIDAHWDGQQMQFTTLMDHRGGEPAEKYPF